MSTNPDSPKHHEPSQGKTSETQTESGQESIRGQNPEDRDRTHQSNYGGGGANGGAEKSAAEKSAAEKSGAEGQEDRG